jgi:hypothetical protein
MTRSDTGCCGSCLYLLIDMIIMYSSSRIACIKAMVCFNGMGGLFGFWALEKVMRLGIVFKGGHRVQVRSAHCTSVMHLPCSKKLSQLHAMMFIARFDALSLCTERETLSEPGGARLDARGASSQAGKVSTAPSRRGFRQALPSRERRWNIMVARTGNPSAGAASIARFGSVALE